MKRLILKGTPVSPGIGIGKCLLLEKQNLEVVRLELENGQIESEIQRFHNALDRTKMQLTALKDQLDARLGEGHSYIMDVQIMMLSDELLLGNTLDILRTQKVNAEWALDQTKQRLTSIFHNMKDR